MFKNILKEIYYVLTGALAVFVILELIWDRIVLSYINLNWVLIVWLIIGIVILMVDGGDSEG